MLLRLMNSSGIIAGNIEIWNLIIKTSMARMDIPEALDKKIWCDPAELLSNVSSAVLNFSKPLWVESIESLWKLTQIVWMNRVFITGRLASTSSLRSPWRKAFLTSNWDESWVRAECKRVRMVAFRATGLKVTSRHNKDHTLFHSLEQAGELSYSWENLLQAVCTSI